MSEVLPVAQGSSPYSIAAERRSVFVRWIAVPIAATALLALCAHISIALPLSPVPVTMQTFAVLLLGALLGPGRGALTMALYLAEGASGLPVFSPHGVGGLAQMVGPTAGYLLSYPLAAALAGGAFGALRKGINAPVAAFAAGVLAELPIFLFGAAWLQVALHLSLRAAVTAGVSPYLAGEGVKLLLLAAAVPLLLNREARNR